MRLTTQSFLTLVSGILFSLTLISAHQGHEHDHDHSFNPDTLPETENEWKDPAVHTMPFNGVTLKWKEDPTNPRYAIFKMSGRTGGYVSIGFCVVWTGGMSNCDIVLGWVDTAGIAHVHDYFASGNTAPTLDTNQNCELVSGKESNGVTSVVFKRLWDTGDDAQDANLEHNQNVHVIYAWHDQDPLSSTDFHKHGDGTRGHTMKAVAIKGHQHGSATNMGSSFSITAMCAIAWYYLY